MTSRFVLDEFDLDLPPTRLLVVLRFLFFVLVIAGAVDGVVILDEAVFGDGALLRLRLSYWVMLSWLRLGRVGWCCCSWMKVHGSLALSHRGKPILVKRQEERLVSITGLNLDRYGKRERGRERHVLDLDRFPKGINQKESKQI